MKVLSLARKIKVHFKCDKCGKEISYIPDDLTGDNMFKQNKCHTITINNCGFYSKLETNGDVMTVNLCDECAATMFEDFLDEAL